MPRLFAVVAETVTDRRLPASVESDPSVTDTAAAPAAYNAITPLAPEETDATPDVKVMVVGIPKSIATPLLSFTVAT